MKSLLLHIVIIFQCFSVFAQDEQNLDSVRIALKTHTKRDSVRVDMLNKVTMYYATRDITKNEAVLEEAMAISQEIGYTMGYLNSGYALASLYIQQGNYDKGLELALRTKEGQVKLNDVEGIVNSNSIIAIVYTELGEPKKAIDILRESIDLLKDDPYSNSKANAHFYLANAHLGLKEYDLASENFIEAKAIAINNNFEIGVQISNSSLGVIELEKKNYLKAISYLEQPKKFYTEKNQQTYVAHTNLELGKAYLGLKNYEQAETLMQEAAGIYKSQEKWKNLEQSYASLNEVCEAKKDYKKANFYLNERYRIKDSILSIDQVKIIEELQTKYETETIKKEKEIAQIENAKNKNLFIGAAIIAGLILLSSLFYLGRIRATKRAEIVSLELKETQKRLALEKQYRDSELKALKAQMNPHFIFNALNSIQDYIVLNQKNLASDYLGKFADLIRNYLHYSDTGYISIPEEIENLKRYLDLEKLRFEEDLKYSFEIKEDINSDVYKIPTMLIQPYIENALKHGLLHKKEDKQLSIRLSRKQENTLTCEIVDNGIGRERSREINAQRNKRHKSFALKANTERLDLLNYGKSRKIGVEIIDLKNEEQALGTKVILHIPIHIK